MNVNSLNKWKIIDKILENNMFEIKFTIDDYNHQYYSDSFSGHIQYDIDDDSCIIFDENNKILVELEGSNLNGITISQYLI